MEEPRGKSRSACVHVFSRTAADGEGKEENPIRNSIKNRFIKNTAAEMRGKRADMIIGFVLLFIGINLSVSVRG